MEYKAFFLAIASLRDWGRLWLDHTTPNSTCSPIRAVVPIELNLSSAQYQGKKNTLEIWDKKAVPEQAFSFKKYDKDGN